MGSDPVQPLEYARQSPRRRPPLWVWVLLLGVGLQFLIWPAYFRHRARQQALQQLRAATQQLQVRLQAESKAAEKAWADIDAAAADTRADIEKMNNRTPTTRRDEHSPDAAVEE